VFYNPEISDFVVKTTHGFGQFGQEQNPPPCVIYKKIGHTEPEAKLGQSYMHTAIYFQRK
jgi:hypothetical protein